MNQGLPEKCLAQVPGRFAIEMIKRGWILRNDIVWHKPNHMPSSVKDRFACSWEHLFLFAKQRRYFFDLDAVRVPHKFLDKLLPAKQPRQNKGHSRKGPPPGKRAMPNKGEAGVLHPEGKNPGDIFRISTRPYPEAHFAVYPEQLCETPIKAGCPALVCCSCGTPKLTRTVGGSVAALNIRARDVQRGRIKSGDRRASGREVSEYCEREYAPKPETELVMGCTCDAGFKPGIVLDPFAGAGTTLVVAKKLGRHFLGIEINPEYVKMARGRLGKVGTKCKTSR
jgi:DNA modification methylase